MYRDAYDRGIVKLFTRFASVAAIAVVLLGAVVLGGWFLELDTIKSLHPALAPMKPNTALAFMLLGVSLWSWIKRHVSVARSSAILVSALGLATLFEHGTNVDLGIDHLLLFGAPKNFPPRMSIVTAASIFLLGLSLLRFDRRQQPRRVHLTEILALAPLASSVLVLLGYGTPPRSLTRRRSSNVRTLHRGDETQRAAL